MLAKDFVLHRTQYIYGLLNKAIFDVITVPNILILDPGGLARYPDDMDKGL